MDECTRHRHAHSEMNFVAFAVCTECVSFVKSNFVIFHAKCVTPICFVDAKGCRGRGMGVTVSLLLAGLRNSPSPKFPLTVEFPQIPLDGRIPQIPLDGRIPQIPSTSPGGEVGTFSRDCRLARLDRWEQVVGMIMPRLFNSAI